MSGEGLCIWLTGLSGSGKSTIAGELELELRRLGQEVTVFDGDAVRLADVARSAVSGGRAGMPTSAASRSWPQTSSGNRVS